LIKIGIEVSRRNLHCDLIENPGRYFFIQEEGCRIYLCIQTCDSQGENTLAHNIDVLAPNEEGDLYSIFEEVLKDIKNDISIERQEWKGHSFLGNRYPISSQLEQMLSIMPDFVDWIISSILTRGRNLVIYPNEEIDELASGFR
jgi:hypothetical protein